jgi:type I restriction enzyme S subunit
MIEGFKKIQLKDACNIFADGDWIERKDQSSEGIRLVQTGNIGFGFFKDKKDKSRYISEETFKRLNCTEIVPGDLLVSRLPDPVGKSCIIPEINSKMITGVDCTIIRPKDNLSSEFLGYYQMSYQYLKDVQANVSGATRQRISRKKLGLIEIPLPPLPQQKQIVAILDKAFAAIDTAKANAEQNLQNAKELFESYLQNVFENKGDDWQVEKLGVLGKLTSSKRIYKKEYVSSGVPFYRSKEIKELSHKRKLSIELYISEQRYTEIKNKFEIPKQGDLLLTAVGTIGEMYIVKKDEKFYFKDGNIMWLKDFSSLNSYYLKYALTNFVERLKALSQGAAYSALTIEKLKEYSIPIPPIEEQEKIVLKLDALSAECKKLEAIYTKKIADLEEMKKSILQKAFSGQLNTIN